MCIPIFRHGTADSTTHPDAIGYIKRRRLRLLVTKPARQGACICSARPDASLLRPLRVRPDGRHGVPQTTALLLPTTRIRNHSHVRQANICRCRRWPAGRPSGADAPGSSIGQAVRHVASRQGRTRKPCTPASPRMVVMVQPSAICFRQEGQPDLFPIVGTLDAPIVSSVRAVATRQRWFPGSSVMRRSWLANHYALGRTTVVPSRACLLDNVRQCDRCGLPWDHGCGQDGTSFPENGNRPRRRLWRISPLLPYTPYTSHHAVTRSAIEPAAT